MNDRDVVARLVELHDRIQAPVTSPGADALRGKRMLRRRRTMVGGAVAAVVVAVLGVIAGTTGGSLAGDRIDPVQPSPSQAPAQDVLALPGAAEGFPALEPGSYSIDPDGDETTPLRVTYQVPFEGWQGWLGAVKFGSRSATMLTISMMTNVVTDGCARRGDTPLQPPVGPSVDDLATALTRLSPFETTEPPTDVTLFGYPGKHLELTVPKDLRTLYVENSAAARMWARVEGRGDGVWLSDFGEHGPFQDCWDGQLHSWFAPNNGDQAFAGYHWAGQTEEFWILDVEGTRLVFVEYNSPESPTEDIAERDAIFDSIRVQP